jgi:hypothetical protein
MQRESTFRIGGILSCLLGLGLAYGLFAAGAGVEYVEAWLAAGIAVGFGAFFIYVAHDEAKTRREYLQSVETPNGNASGRHPR